MDALQIQHAIDQIELNQNVLKEELLNRTNDRAVELEEELEDALNKVETLEEEKDDLEMRVQDLEGIIKRVSQKLGDFTTDSPNDSEFIEEVIEILSA